MREMLLRNHAAETRVATRAVAWRRRRAAGGTSFRAPVISAVANNVAMGTGWGRVRVNPSPAPKEYSTSHSAMPPATRA